MNLETLANKYQSRLGKAKNTALNYLEDAKELKEATSFYASHLWKNRKDITKDAGQAFVGSLDNLAEKANYTWQERGRLANEAEDKLGNVMFNTGKYLGKKCAQVAHYLWKNKSNLPETLATDLGITGINILNTKGKRYAVDGTGIVPPLFLLSTINEQFIHPDEISWAASGKARLVQATYVPFIAGPVMEVRDWTRRKIFNIHDEENVSFIRDASANTAFTLGMNTLFYVPSLIAAGITDTETLFWAVVTNVGIRSVLHTTVTFPWVKSWRKVWGTTPKPKKAKEQPNPFLLPEEAFNYFNK